MDTKLADILRCIRDGFDIPAADALALIEAAAKIADDDAAYTEMRIKSAPAHARASLEGQFIGAARIADEIRAMTMG